MSCWASSYWPLCRSGADRGCSAAGTGLRGARVNLEAIWDGGRVVV
jgi:hypothetical protein